VITGKGNVRAFIIGVLKKEGNDGNEGEKSPEVKGRKIFGTVVADVGRIGRQIKLPEMPSEGAKSPITREKKGPDYDL